jgi:glycosyltransferase involved in cell wall biosynthesis
MAGHVLVLRDVDCALDVMARAAVLVRASDFDGDANTVKEAMLLGVPVLATDLPGRPPGLELVARGDFRALGEKLRRMLESPDPDCTERNRAFARADIERNEAAIFGLYEEALR